MRRGKWVYRKAAENAKRRKERGSFNFNRNAEVAERCAEEEELGMMGVVGGGISWQDASPQASGGGDDEGTSKGRAQSMRFKTSGPQDLVHSSLTPTGRLSAVKYGDIGNKRTGT